ncbi:META domain-containing protein [Spirosoma montaniterrae]|uniref:DUF306 domain-containing protein n=1 Tax=Spirosoma montaniterrae TaxID=1178516 RepID=A0A1P9WXC1_9BACT|nr:META domain-containing protein [Spirosoma montaniterrae]AQG80000.1 hypothetical protein AWR27_12075 [Spirosoma montaniterrae]
MKFVPYVQLLTVIFCVHSCVLHHPGGDFGGGNTGNGNAGGGTTVVDNLTRYRWGLVRFGNTNNPLTMRSAGPSIYLPAGGNGEGFTGCRQFRCNFSANASSRYITFRNIQFQNYDPCNDGRTEDRFLDALKRTNRYQIDGNRLTLYSYADELAVFTTSN